MLLRRGIDGGGIGVWGGSDDSTGMHDQDNLRREWRDIDLHECMPMSRYTVCVDFDGVIHSYTSPWVNAHTIPDPPVPGAIKWLADMLEKFDVVIFSTRCKTWRGRRAMRKWLTHQAECECSEPFGVCILHDVKFAKTKPAALIYLDDRAVRFTGPDSWPTVDSIHKALPWNKARNSLLAAAK